MVIIAKVHVYLKSTLYGQMAIHNFLKQSYHFVCKSMLRCPIKGYKSDWIIQQWAVTKEASFIYCLNEIQTTAKIIHYLYK